MLGLFRTASFPTRRCRPSVETLDDRSVPAVFTVTNRSDHNPGSLRDAIESANALVGEDTIQFAPLLTGTIGLTTGDIDITDDLIIQGPGANRLTVSGNRDFRIFDLEPAPGPISVSITGLKLTRGAAIDAVDGDDGGAIRGEEGNLFLKNCVVSGNAAEDRAGGISIDNGSLKVVNCTFANNIASGGGALYVDDGRLAAKNSRFLSNSTYDDGTDGGALYLSNTTATVKNCVVTGNTCDDDGGGIYSDGGHLTIINSTISQNTAAFGGGISMFSGGRLTVHNSTISGNRANGQEGGDSPGGGGAFLYNVATLIVNSTISGNVDQTGDPVDYTGGGGLHLYGGRTVIRNSTIAFNSTVGRGGGIFLRDSEDQVGRLTLASTIVSNSTAPAGNFDVARPAGEGRVTAVFSLIQRIQSGFINVLSRGNILDVNPMLLPLADNGGPTLTHSFTAGSPARDAGSNPGRVQFDQRGPGFPRVKNGSIDIGALEL